MSSVGRFRVLVQDDPDEAGFDYEMVGNGYTVHSIPSAYGPLRAVVSGKLPGPHEGDKPVLLTISDVGLWHSTCYGSLFRLIPSSSPINRMCVVHLDLPGQWPGAEPLERGTSILKFDELVDAIEDVRVQLGISSVVGFGVGAGAYLLLSYAQSYASHVRGLFLVSPSAQGCSWYDWLYTKLGVTVKQVTQSDSLWIPHLVDQYFCEQSKTTNPELIQHYTKKLSKMNGKNVSALLNGNSQRLDISDGLKQLKCRVASIVGAFTSSVSQVEHIHSLITPGQSEYAEIEDVGTLITEENPHCLLKPLDLFLNGLGLV